MAGAEMSAGEAAQITIAWARPAGSGSRVTIAAVTIGETMSPQATMRARRPGRPIWARIFGQCRGGEHEDEGGQQRAQPGGKAGEHQSEEDAAGHEAGGVAAEKSEPALNDVHLPPGTLSRRKRAG